MIGLPSGVTDGTSPVDSIFYVNVDSEAPIAANTGSWEITDENSEEIGPGIISSTQFDCISVKAFIQERQKLQEGDVLLNWMYFKDGGIGLNSIKRSLEFHISVFQWIWILTQTLFERLLTV